MDVSIPQNSISEYSYHMSITLITPSTIVCLHWTIRNWQTMLLRIRNRRSFLQKTSWTVTLRTNSKRWSSRLNRCIRKKKDWPNRTRRKNLPHPRVRYTLRPNRAITSSIPPGLTNLTLLVNLLISLQAASLVLGLRVLPLHWYPELLLRPRNPRILTRFHWEGSNTNTPIITGNC